MLRETISAKERVTANLRKRKSQHAAARVLIAEISRQFAYRKIRRNTPAGGAIE